MALLVATCFPIADSTRDDPHASSGVLQNAMFPKPQDDPPSAFQFLGLSDVTLRIHAALLGPIGCVALRCAAVVAFRAHVPEATIDENSYPQSRESKIRFSWKLGRGSIASQSRGPSQLSKAHFRLGVARPDARHVEGSGALVVNVHRPWIYEK